MYFLINKVGFCWVFKQEFFVVLVWMLGWEDVLFFFVGDIEDEDSILFDCQEQCVGWFSDYSDWWVVELEQVFVYVDLLVLVVLLGQLILVGYYSECCVCWYVQKIENGMKCVVMLFECVEYWEQCVQVFLWYVKYKECLDVCYCCIKKIEVELCKF